MSRYLFVIVLGVTLFFSFWSRGLGITAMPKFWRDEAIPFEIARSFAETGKLDVVTAPHVWETRSYLTHATGFPLTIPLAGFFKLFGVGVTQSRLFMVLWIVATVALLFLVFKSFFGERAALVGTLLVSTFAPFYANGRTTTGEIPGFFFLLLALWFLYKKNKPAFAGFFFALCAVTKPSMYLLVFPAVALEILIVDWRQFFARVLRVALGALPVILLWIFIIVPHPFASASWRELFTFYQHPFHDPSLFSQFPGVLWELLSHTTVLYFAVISFFLGHALYKGVFRDGAKRLVVFTYMYGAFALVYFLRSPGWLRFLVAYEFLALALLAPVLQRFSKKISLPAFLFPLGIISLQVFQFFFLSNIPVGSASIETATFINSQILKKPEYTIGLINVPTITPLISSYKKYQVGEIGGFDTYGQNPLVLPQEQLPTFILAYNNDFAPYTDRFSQEYNPVEVAEIHGYKIFEKNEN